MISTTFLTCLDCDHDHELETIHGEFEDYCDVPEVCEACGAELADCASEASDRRSERQQMGICG